MGIDWAYKVWADLTPTAIIGSLVTAAIGRSFNQIWEKGVGMDSVFIAQVCELGLDLA